MSSSIGLKLNTQQRQNLLALFCGPNLGPIWIEGRKMRSRVKLRKNKIIMSQVYSTLPPHPPPLPPPPRNPNKPLVFKMCTHSTAKIPEFSL